MEAKRFYKIMISGFDQQLNLPTAFCKKLKQDEKSEPEFAVLKTQLGIWEIQVCKSQEGLISFQNGWPDFARRHRLNFGDLIAFEHTGNFHFKAFVFDISACEKQLVKIKGDTSDEEVLVSTPNPILKRKHSEVNKRPDVTFTCKNPFFVVTMRPYAHRVTIPQAFWKSNYINDKKRLVVRDRGGKDWRLNMCVSKTGVSRCKLGAGWTEFYAKKKFKDGDVCVFELRKDADGGSIGEAAMDVHIYRCPD